jgi:alkaline phosphatase
MPATAAPARGRPTWSAVRRTGGQLRDQPDGRSQSHTGTRVRIAAQGPQAANVVGVSDQTDLFSTMARALGLAT